MENTQATGHAAPAGHKEPEFALYIKIFVALCVLTLISFLSNRFINVGMKMPELSAVIILLVSVCKATLVAMFFMHLMWDWMKIYFLMIPVVIMGVMMMIVLMPDILLAWHPHGPPVDVEVTKPKDH